jgi:hypothetical protein
LPTPTPPSNGKSVDRVQLEQAYRKVRGFWTVGQRSLRAHATYILDGSKDAEAEQMKSKGTAGITWSAETLRVARRFAERCPNALLERMLREARERRIRVGYVIFATLFEVSDDRVRKLLWRDYLAAGGWSKRQLEAAIRQRNAPRAGRAWAGRTVRKPMNLKDAADRLAQAAATFERLYQAIATWLKGFDTDQKRRIECSRQAMEALRKAMHRKGGKI